jgi:hypothetical protein
MFNDDLSQPETWKSGFCEKCLKEIYEEDQRDGERDERGND